MHAVPMLEVDDVERSSAWYVAVLGLVSGHGGPHFDMLFAGTPHATPALVQLHRAGDALRAGGVRGLGLTLYVQVADADALSEVHRKASAHGATVEAPPAWQPLAHHHAMSLRDPDGYLVVVCTPSELG